MRAVCQRVSEARVLVDGRGAGEIGLGLVVLVGVADGDTEADADRLAAKIARLRIFPDDEGRFDRSVLDANGRILAVSQFTLLADTSRGNRPSFAGALPPLLRGGGRGRCPGCPRRLRRGDARRARERRAGDDRPRHRALMSGRPSSCTAYP
jgi:D-Tyr-tRNA(Tyr) deacylase